MVRSLSGVEVWSLSGAEMRECDVAISTKVKSLTLEGVGWRKALALKLKFIIP